MSRPDPQLTTFQEGSKRADPTRLCFASLPAELRNHIYAQTLKYPGPITLHYNTSTHRFTHSGASKTSSRTPFEALSLLSSLDHYICLESRSYFFANNTFCISTTQTITTDADYVGIYIGFLSSIGATARRSLRNLRLVVRGDSKAHRPCFSTAAHLFALLSSCLNLQYLDLFLEVDYFYMDQVASLKSFLNARGYPVTPPWPVILSCLQQLTHLKRVDLHVVCSSRWRYINFSGSAAAQDTLPARDDTSSALMRFQVMRPGDEARGLVDQVKGTVRRGLRSKVAVRVCMEETWDLYGADVLIGTTVEGVMVLRCLRKVKLVQRKARGF